MIGRTNVASGGSKIDELIEQYQVLTGENVSAGDFVEFIGNYNIEDSVNLNNTSYSGMNLSAVKLDDTHVFIAHNADGSSGTSTRLYGIVCSISNGTITAGTDTKLSNTTYGGEKISASALSESRVFIAHSGDGANSSSKLYGIVCFITNNEITTIGTDTKLSDIGWSGSYISCAGFTSAVAFVCHRTSNNYLYGIKCSLSGTSITIGTDTQLNSTNYGAVNPSMVKLDNTHVFIAHGGGSTGQYNVLYGLACYVQYSTITAGTDGVLSGTEYSGDYISATALSSSKIFIAHSGGGNNDLKKLYGIIREYEDINIYTNGTDTLICNEEYSGYNVSASNLSSSKIFVSHNAKFSLGDGGILYGTATEIDGLNIVKKISKKISDYSSSASYISASALTNNEIFVANSQSTKLYGNAIGIGNSIIATKTITNSSQTINGVAKTGGTGGQTIDVYVPNI